jgi:hypothetical protein
MKLQQHHISLINGLGKCSRPLGSSGVPTHFCDAPAFGEQIDGQRDGLCPHLACPKHGGPARELTHTHFWFERDDYDPEVGVTHTSEGPPSFSGNGFEAAVKPVDAISAALPQCHILWGVTLGGEIVNGPHSQVAQERTYIWRLDVREELEVFARRCAMEAIDLWAAPDYAREYFKTGDPSMRQPERLFGTSKIALKAAEAAADVELGPVGSARGALYYSSMASRSSASSTYGDVIAKRQDRNTFLKDLILEKLFAG